MAFMLTPALIGHAFIFYNVSVDNLWISLIFLKFVWIFFKKILKKNLKQFWYWCVVFTHTYCEQIYL